MNVKDINNVFLNPNFIIQMMFVLNQYGLIDDITLRNALIRKEWIDNKNNGEPNKEFLEKAAEKYCLSTKAIESILYSDRGKNKNGYDNQVRESNYKILKEILNKDEKEIVI